MTEWSATTDHATDGERIEAMFARLLTALERAAPDLMALWQQFEACLTAHMDEEEQRVTPKIAAIRLREALAILQEHRYLRTRLKELGAALLRGDLRPEIARSFRHELRAHARHEDAILRSMAGDRDGPS